MARRNQAPRLNSRPQADRGKEKRQKSTKKGTEGSVIGVSGSKFFFVLSALVLVLSVCLLAGSGGSPTQKDGKSTPANGLISPGYKKVGRMVEYAEVIKSHGVSTKRFQEL